MCLGIKTCQFNRVFVLGEWNCGRKNLKIMQPLYTLDTLYLWNESKKGIGSFYGKKGRLFFVFNFSTIFFKSKIVKLFKIREQCPHEILTVNVLFEISRLWSWILGRIEIKRKLVFEAVNRKGKQMRIKWNHYYSINKGKLKKKKKGEWGKVGSKNLNKTKTIFT